MAAVDFDEAYVHDGTDLTSYFAQAPREIDYSADRDGSVQTYAGGRTRVVATDSEPVSVTVSWAVVSLANKAFLEDLRGDLVLYRDGEGHFLYGSYFSVSSAMNIQPANTCSISLTITEVTHDIEV